MSVRSSTVSRAPVQATCKPRYPSQRRARCSLLLSSHAPHRPRRFLGGRVVIFARPKSSTFTKPSSLRIIMFSGLMSRWTISLDVPPPVLRRPDTQSRLRRRCLFQSATGRGGLALDELSRNKAATICIPYFMNGEIFRMVQSRNSTRFLLETPHAFRFLREVWR